MEVRPLSGRRVGIVITDVSTLATRHQGRMERFLREGGAVLAVIPWLEFAAPIVVHIARRHPVVVHRHLAEHLLLLGQAIFARQLLHGLDRTLAQVALLVVTSRAEIRSVFAAYKVLLCRLAKVIASRTVSIL